jgi:hypothetical protein
MIFSGLVHAPKSGRAVCTSGAVNHSILLIMKCRHNAWNFQKNCMKQSAATQL